MTFVPDRAMSTHSNYVDTIAQTGVVGIASLLALLVGLGIMGRRARRRLVDVQDRAALGAVLGALPAIFVAMLFGDWLIPFVYNQTIAGFDHSVYSWLMLAMLCGLAASVRRDAAADG
jgi:O-antigen ligase